jgi:hypothetical protein
MEARVRKRHDLSIALYVKLHFTEDLSSWTSSPAVEALMRDDYLHARGVVQVADARDRVSRVATCWRCSVLNNLRPSFDGLTNLRAPLDPAEFRRVWQCRGSVFRWRRR